MSLQNIVLHEALLHKILCQRFLSFSLYCCCFISAYSFHNYLLVWKLAEEISLQSALKCFQSFGPPANGNKSNAKKQCIEHTVSRRCKRLSDITNPLSQSNLSQIRICCEKLDQSFPKLLVWYMDCFNTL